MAAAEQIGRYRLTRRLGTGAFATVWLGHDDELDAPVAIKVLADNWAADADVRARFVAEARLLRRVRDQRVVRVHDIGALDDDRPYFVMDYADGGTVATLLADDQRLDPAAALRLGADGRVLAQTKGDYNGAADPELVTPEQLRGRLWYAVPALGYVNAAAAGHGRVVVVAGVVVGLSGYAGWMFASSARDRRRLAAATQADRAG